MSIGVLIMTHDGIGPALLGTATHMLDGCPLPAKLLNASADSDPDELASHAAELIAELDNGDGVLVMTDLAGATPSNIAAAIANASRRMRIVSGVNLSMLIRVFNYPDHSLDELAEKALSGGRDGIVHVAIE